MPWYLTLPKAFDTTPFNIANTQRTKANQVHKFRMPIENPSRTRLFNVYTTRKAPLTQKNVRQRTTSWKIKMKTTRDRSTTTRMSSIFFSPTKRPDHRRPMDDGQRNTGQSKRIQIVKPQRPKTPLRTSKPADQFRRHIEGQPAATTDPDHQQAHYHDQWTPALNQHFKSFQSRSLQCYSATSGAQSAHQYWMLTVGCHGAPFHNTDTKGWK